MKTMKFLSLAALALIFAACSNDDDALTQQPAEQPVDNMITITAQLASKSGNAQTRAVTDDGTNIVVDWAVDEHLAILYKVSSTKYVADARVKSVDASGNATIEFSVQAGTPDNTACQIVYPLAAAKDDHSGVKNAATLLATQNGTLNANLDVRVGAGTIQTTTPSLTVTTEPVAQFAIFKFTVRLYDGITAINTNPLTITIGSDTYTITPSKATDVLYVALPAVSGKKVIFDAKDGSKKTYTCAKLNTTFAAGKFYQTTLKMRQYVLLGEGLNLKWATCNIGATNPEDFGNYYSWGATATQTTYDWANYPHMQSGQSDYLHINKYTLADGWTDGIWYSGDTFIGENGDGVEHKDLASYNYADDVARQEWGGTWRIPTMEEWERLIQRCSCAWLTDYNGKGVKGLFVGNYSLETEIFLPCAGYYDNAALTLANSYGRYWSSTLPGYTLVARYLEFCSEGRNMSQDERYHGHSVRAVAE